MSLKVREMKLPDFDILKSYNDDNGGTLTSPLLLDVWPVNSSLDSKRRNDWSVEQDRWRFLNDDSSRFVVVVDEDGNEKGNEEIVSMARWHYYPNGYPIQDAWMEVDGSAGPDVLSLLDEDKRCSADNGGKFEFPQGLEVKNMLEFIDIATKQRTEWELTSKACWILTTLVTRIAHRKRGAGGMLVDWGVDKASAMGIPACLEADPDAQSLYKRHGFVEYDTISAGNTSDGSDFSLVRMYKNPS